MTRSRDKEFVIQIFYDGYEKRVGVYECVGKNNLVSINEAKQVLDLLKKYVEENTQEDINKRNIHNENFHVQHLINRKQKLSGYKKQGRVYLMHNTRSNEYKIGFTSKSIENRLKEFKLVDPSVEYLFSFAGTLNDEKELHLFFKTKRLRGEWFKLDLDDVDYIKKNKAAIIYEPTA